MQLADGWHLVGLGVGAQAQTMRFGVLGHAAEVALHNVEINQQRGRIEFSNVHVDRPARQTHCGITSCANNRIEASTFACANPARFMRQTM